MRDRYDIVFMPHKDYHSKTYLGIYNHLKALGVSAAFLKPVERHSKSGAVEALQGHPVTWLENDDFTSVLRTPAAVVTMNDWDLSSAHLLDHCKIMGTRVIGLQEGTTDFLRNNWNHPKYADPKRLPYARADFLLLASDFDASYFADRPHAVIGMDRVEPLFAEEVSFPAAPVVVLNLNFSYKVCLEFSRAWLDSAAAACSALGLDYIISVHPQDETDLSGYEDRIRREPLHDLLRGASLFVSRFSNAIYEALALGKPVVYFNPHGEQARTFNEAEGAFSVARNDDELRAAIAHEVSQREIRARAKPYFESHLSLIPGRLSAERAAEAIANLLRSLPRPQPRRPDRPPAVSIIVPVHDVEPWLDRCLDSLLGQTMGDLQILLVDDASSDGSLALLREYERLDERIVVHRLLLQSGQSRARNIGMMQAHGETTMFVDSDDWLHPDACLKAHDRMRDGENDVVVFDYFDYRQPISTPAQHADFSAVAAGGVERADFLKICSPCTKIYRTAFLRRIEAYFPEATIFEDWFWTMQWATQAKTISALAEPLYFYRRDRTGSTTSGQRSEVEVMRGIVRNLGMSKRFLDARGMDYSPLAILINKADARIRIDKKHVRNEERVAGYAMLRDYLLASFPAGLPRGVTQRSILALYLGAS